MKNTVIMIIGIIVTILTYWGIVASLHCVTEMPWIDCKGIGAVLTIVFGWTPALIIGKDIEDNY